jgi:two-component sensor histidine kinase
VVPLGLIVNELVTNAIKYAFPDGRGGTIKVTFRADAEASKGCLCVADDGVGMTEPRPVGLGLRLIESLARQIEGRVTSKSSDQGTTFQVDFLLVR